MVLVDICANVDLCPYPLGTAEQLAETAERCRLHGTRVLALTADVRDQTQVDDAVHRALEQFGRIDVLVNNAGIVAPAGRRGEELSDDVWRLLIDTNLTGTWRVMKATVPSMIRRRSGSVINVASTAGLVGFGFFAGYVSAKHGVVGLTKACLLTVTRRFSSSHTSCTPSSSPTTLRAYASSLLRMRLSTSREPPFPLTPASSPSKPKLTIPPASVTAMLRS